MLTGSVVADPQGGWIVGGLVFNEKMIVLGGIELRLSPTPTFAGKGTGDYPLRTRPSEPSDGGTGNEVR
jgi:hypothetical protein